MTIRPCLRIAGLVDDADVEDLFRRIDAITADGVSTEDAQRMAVTAMLNEAMQRRDALQALAGQAGRQAMTEATWTRPEDWDEEVFYSGRGDVRGAMIQLMAGRNRGLSRVNPASVIERDIAAAAQAIEYVAGEIQAGRYDQVEVPLGPMPHTLHMLGAPMQMMQIHASIVRKVMVDKHAEDFSGATPRQMIEAIYRPAIVTQARAADEWELTTRLKNSAGAPITFVVKQNTNIGAASGQGGAKVASIMSAYARPVAGGKDSIIERALTGKVKYADLGEAQASVIDLPARSGPPRSAQPPAGSVPADRAWRMLSEPLRAGIAAKRIRTDVDLLRFIGDTYRGDWADAPAFSAQEGGQATAGQQAQPQSFKLRPFGPAAVGIEAIQDRYNRWKQAIDDVRKQGGRITEENDFYRAEERYWGTVGAEMDDFKKEIEAFVDAVAADKLYLDDVALYAYAQHAEERNRYIAAIRPTMPDGGSGMLTQDARDLLDEAKAAGLDQALAKHAATLRQWIQGTRDILYRRGLIDQDEYDGWMQSYQNYVPLRGLDGAPERMGTGQGFNIRGQEGRSAMGRKSQARQIIEQIIQDRTRAFIRTGKNEVLRSFLAFVLDNPSRNLWEVNAVQTKPVSTVDENGNRVIEERQVVIEDDRTVTVKDGGKEIHILVRDERLRQQLQNLQNDEIGRVVGAMLFANRILARLYTSLNPVFTVLNGFRDFQAAIFGTIDEMGFLAVPRLLANMPGSVVEAYRAEAGSFSPDYEEYRRTGGKTGFFDFKTLDKQTEDLQRMLANAERIAIDPRRLGPAALDFVEAANAGIENAVRLATFKTAKGSGKSVAEAARIAKNITVNFNRRGAMTPALSAWFLFFNPAVQGTARIVQALANPKVVATLGMGMLGVAMLAARNAGMGEDDDGVAWWDKIPDEVKERNLVIVLPPGAAGGDQVPGSQIGRYVKIPMPYGYNFFAVVANQVVDVWRNAQDPRRGRGAAEASGKAFTAFMGAWVPVQELGRSLETPQSAVLAAVPDSLNPLAQVAINTSAFGRPLRPDDQFSKGLPDSSAYFPAQAGTLFQRASAAANRATGGDQFRPGLIDVAPSTLETVVRGYGGGPATFMLDLLNGFYVRHTIKRTEPRFEAFPFAKQLYGVIDAETDRMLGYQRLEEAAKIVEPMRRAMRVGGEEAMESRAEMRAEFGPMIELGTVLDATRERLSEIRKRELKIIDSDKPDAQKIAELELIAARRRQVLQRFNAAFDRARLRLHERQQQPAAPTQR